MGTVDQQAAALKLAMQKWLADTSKHGDVIVVPNLKQLWLQAARTTEGLRILIAYTGKKPRSPFSRQNATRRVDNQWSVAVTKGEGPSADRGSFLTDSTGNTDAFLKEVDEVESVCLGCQGISMEGPANDFLGTEPMAVNNMQMAGYIIRFSTASDLPMPIGQTEIV